MPATTFSNMQLSNSRDIVIAAKNEDKEEIACEISDLLYHIMVLMAEKGIFWEDITQELTGK